MVEWQLPKRLKIVALWIVWRKLELEVSTYIEPMNSGGFTNPRFSGMVP